MINIWSAQTPGACTNPAQFGINSGKPVYEERMDKEDLDLIDPNSIGLDSFEFV